MIVFIVKECYWDYTNYVVNIVTGFLSRFDAETFVEKSSAVFKKTDYEIEEVEIQAEFTSIYI